MLKMMRKMGLSSNLMYTLGFGSIGMSIATWGTSLRYESNDIGRADRWGIFVGQWAPTFFALGTALRLEEQWGARGRRDMEAEHRLGDIRDPMHVG